MIDPYLVDPIIIMKSGVSPGWDEPGAYDPIDVMGKIEYKTRLIERLGGEQVTAGTIGAITSSAMVLLSESIEMPHVWGEL